ncbi:MAG: rRNA pseudouridine synthase, partial [Paracoccaceae bacterium]|nr:rRNA pseudouridine synthase [Paracoccaceae bacterium]
RIAKVFARAGITSRREAEKLIETGRVTVNGEVITRAALNVTPADKIVVNGKALDAPEPARLWLYHKPTGLVTTTRDEQGRPTIYDDLPEDLPRVMSVGRLDLNSEGLLLLTNDGAVKRQLELPSTGWLRKYRVRVNGRVTEPQLEPLRQGIKADGEDFQPMIVTLDRQQGANAWLTVGLREGKNREIRRAMEAVGLTVNRLIRTSYGPFQLGQLKPGEVEEVRRRVLRDQLGLDTKDDEDAADSTTKPRKVIVRRNKSREAPSESDLFGDRPGSRPARGSKTRPRRGSCQGGRQAASHHAPRQAAPETDPRLTPAGGGPFRQRRLMRRPSHWHICLYCHVPPSNHCRHPLTFGQGLDRKRGYMSGTGLQKLSFVLLIALILVVSIAGGL